MMDSAEFVNLVAQMRLKQKAYFRYRDKKALEACKVLEECRKLEQKVDDAIEAAVEAEQPSLFDEQEGE